MLLCETELQRACMSCMLDDTDLCMLLGYYCDFFFNTFETFCPKILTMTHGEYFMNSKCYICSIFAIALLGYDWTYHKETSLQWCHNGYDSISNHQPHDCLLKCLFRHRSKKTSKLRVTGLCAGNSPKTGEFPPQRASYAENVSIWWRHHVTVIIA